MTFRFCSCSTTIKIRYELVREALNVGYDNLVGRLEGGIDAWTQAGLPTTSTELVTADELSDSIVDVRQREEFAAGHIPRATSVELADVIDEDATHRARDDDVRTRRTRHDRSESILERTGRG